MSPGPDLVAVLAVGGLILVPGLPLAMLVSRPGRTRPLTVLAAAVGLGYACVATGSFALAYAGILSAPSIVLFVALVTVPVSASLLRSRRGLDHVLAAREDIRRHPLDAGVHAAVVAAFAAVRWSYPGVMSIAPTSLRYWADAVEIADRHGFPAATLQWGHLIPITTSKVLLNTFDASVHDVVGSTPLVALGALLFVVSMSLFVATLALAHELGIRRAAPALAMLLFGGALFHSDLALDLSRNRAENWGRLVALVAAALAVHAVRERPLTRPDPVARELPEERRSRFEHRVEVAAAGVLFGVGVATHLVALAAIGGFTASYLVAASATRRWSLPEWSTASGVAAVTVVLGAIILCTAPGDIGFGGAFDQTAYAAAAATGASYGIADPTFYISTGRMSGSVAGGNGGAAAVGSVLHPLAAHFGDTLTLALAVVAALVLLTLTVRRARASHLWTAVLAAWIFLGVLVLVSVVFELHYDEFALANFGARRLFDYAPLVWAVVVAVAFEVVLARSIGGSHRRRRFGPGVAGIAATAVLAAAVLPSGVAPAVRIDDGVDAALLLEWVSANVPCEGRVLMDRRTLGTFEVLTGHAGTVEGMGPHIRPSILGIAMHEMLDAWTYFRHPQDGGAYLREQGVAAVVISSRGNAIGGLTRFEDERRAAFDHLPYLVPAFANPAGTVYRVRDYVGNAALPSVSGRPGYRCAAPASA
jgi:hypothetical protein